LGATGFAHSDARAMPLAPGQPRDAVAGESLTARDIVWLEADQPIVRYPEFGAIAASPVATRLVMADQIRVEVVADGQVSPLDTPALLARHDVATLGKHSAELAQRIAAGLVIRDSRQRQRWQQTLEVDEGRAHRSFQRLRDIAALRWKSKPEPVV